MVLVILLLMWAVLVALFWGGSLWLQAYLYNDPAADLYWRAPAAASVLTLFLGLWCYLNYRSYDPQRAEPLFDTLFFFAPTDSKVFTEFRAPRDGEDQRYQLRGSDYVQVKPPHRKWEVSKEIIVDEGGREVHFKADLDEKGHFKRAPRPAPRGLGWLIGTGPPQPLKYHDDHGHVMTEDAIGRTSTFRWGLFLGNVLLNGVHLILWFVCLWLLLHFQWSHGLGIALIFWTLMTVIIVHMLMSTVEDRARLHHQPPPAPRALADYRMCMMSPSWTR